MEEEPFPDLQISCAAFLDGLSGRSKCSQCSKSRKYYCYTCYLPVPEVVGRVPNIRLPLKIDIIKHPAEVDGKSTAIHAGVIAPEDVTIYTYPVIPDYIDKTKVVLVFPGKDAVTLGDLAAKWNIGNNSGTHRESSLKRKLVNCDNADANTDNGSNKVSRVEESEDNDSNTDKHDETGSGEKQNGCEKHEEIKDVTSGKEEDTTPTKDAEICQVSDQPTEGVEADVEEAGDGEVARNIRDRLVPGCPLERVIFVDSTWNQTKTICNDERLKGITHIELQTRKTKFWRHQRDIPNTYLSTIEAIFYFVRDFHELFLQPAYTGQYDNLLFFFKFMHSKIRNLYDGGGNLKAYKQREKT